VEEWFNVTGDSIHITIKAFPSASKNEIFSIRNNHLCIRIAAAPEDSKANARLCEFLSQSLGCTKRDVILIKGEKSRQKVVAIPLSYLDKLKEITSF